MALPATHIRFALDLKDRYKVNNLSHYLSGSVYPDSRYLTGIDRALTHNNEILKKDWANTDFKKGWQTHCLCDLAQIKARNSIFSDILKNDSPKDNLWYTFTSLKIIQDMDDSKKISVKDYLAYLDYASNPSSEDLRQIKKFNQLIITMYSTGEQIAFYDYKNFWLGLNLNPDVVDNVLAKTTELLEDESIVNRVGGLYKSILEIANNL